MWFKNVSFNKLTIVIWGQFQKVRGKQDHQMRLTISCQIGEEQACRFTITCKKNEWHKIHTVARDKEPTRTTVAIKTQHALYIKCLFAEFVFFLFWYLTSSIDVKRTGIPEQKAHVVIISTFLTCWIYFIAFEYIFT